MGGGVSAGGGRSSLGYLFGSGEAPKPAEEHGAAAPRKQVPISTSNDNDGPPQKSTACASSPPAVDVVTKEIPAGIQGSQANNYFRADGQNCHHTRLAKIRYDAYKNKCLSHHIQSWWIRFQINEIDRQQKCMHAALSGGSSLGYLFGGGGGS